jgi:hypothetical protein
MSDVMVRSQHLRRGGEDTGGCVVGAPGGDEAGELRGEMDPEEVDTGQTISRLNRNQVALQAAALQVTRSTRFRQLNYLPNP